LFVHEIRDFIVQMKQKKVTYPTFEDAVACQKVLDTVEKSNTTRKWEKVK
jgi:predicted dehydrogenase